MLSEKKSFGIDLLLLLKHSGKTITPKSFDVYNVLSFVIIKKTKIENK